MSLVEAVFWASVGAVLYSTFGYPLLLLAVASLRRPVPLPPLAEAALPNVAVLVAAYNEERHLEERVRNLLALDYPSDRVRIYIGSDGSSDRSGEILRGVASDRIRVAEFPRRRGKASVLNDLVALTGEEILVFTDANTSFRPDVLRQLVRHFAAPDVGCVCGELLLTGSAGDNQDHVYWRYERMLKLHESSIGALLGANGGVYAMRRAAYRAIPADTIVDDFWISMQVLESGQRCVYAREALAYEAIPERIADEFRRRVRIGTGNYQALRRFAGLLHPRHGPIAFSFLSHKLMRWLVPHAMVLALATNVLLATRPLYAGLLAGQLLFYGCALAGWAWARGGVAPRPLRVPLFFVSMNLGLLVGWWEYLRGRASGIWVRTAR
jgi:cellulose synthase/poly-beta-1,6-N-acetylglucosamine synthase-like glycosyltransferase